MILLERGVGHLPSRGPVRPSPRCPRLGTRRIGKSVAGSTTKTFCGSHGAQRGFPFRAIAASHTCVDARKDGGMFELLHSPNTGGFIPASPVSLLFLLNPNLSVPCRQACALSLRNAASWRFIWDGL